MQDAPYLNEQQLLAEISQLREQFPQTQDLYREVCTVLFFRHGITPTTNKLYQLVRKGSMSAPAEALTKFWQDLREKSRVRIEHPDLPEALKTAAGEMTAILWSQAQASAQESLAAFREQAEARVTAAETALAAASIREQGAINKSLHAEEELRNIRQEAQVLGQQLAAAHATTAALEAQLKRVQKDNEAQQSQAQKDGEAQQQRLADARREFALELDKLRSAAALAEDRMAAAEKRALLEIDRERGLALRAQKDLEASRGRATTAADKAAAERNALQQQLGDLRQQSGKLEGSLQAMTANRDQLARELGAARDSLAATERNITELRKAAPKPQRATLRKHSAKKPLASDA